MKRIISNPIKPYYNMNSNTLILGSFPSIKSREIGFFYGHKQNRMWRVLASVFEEKVPKSVEERKEFLKRNKIAMWDPVKECEIIGSKDSSIKVLKTNDISKILESCDIKNIYCAGKKSLEIYNKYLKEKLCIEAIYLPSTSPANNQIKFEDLVEKYKVIKNGLE